MKMINTKNRDDHKKTYENNATHCDAAASAQAAHWHHDTLHIQEDSGTGNSRQQVPEWQLVFQRKKLI
jgi:hypothetical protein